MTSSKPANRPSRAGELVEAAIGVFGRSGMATTTMDQIAEEAGLTVSAVYYHFATKEELFHVAFQLVRDEVDEMVERCGPPRGTLRGALRTVFRWAWMHPERARLLWVFGIGASPAVGLLWEEFVDRHVDGTAWYQGRAPTTPADAAARRLAARTAVGAGNTAALHWLAGDLFTEVGPEEMTEAVASMMERLLDPGSP